MLEITSDNVDLSSPAALVRKLAEPALPGESVKSLILKAWRRARDAARLLGVEEMSARRIKACWHGEVEDIWSREMRVLRTAALGKAAPTTTEEHNNVDNEPNLREVVRNLKQQLTVLQGQLDRIQTRG